MISLTTLGPVSVSVNDGPAPSELLWRKNLALLVYLVRSPRGRSRDHLIGTLWPEKDDARARHSLNEALRVLRKCLGHSLLTTGETVRLSGQAVNLDVDRLDQLETRALGQPFLEGLDIPDAPAFNDWLAGERRRVQADQLNVLCARAGQALREGDPERARISAEAALALDSHHEVAARLAMRALALEGSRALALELFDRLVERLESDLAIRPDGETVALAGRIRQAQGLRRSTAAGPSSREPAVPLFGPAREQLATLSGLWEETSRSGARVALILGDPGTGKTRLIQDLAARARLDGGVVSVGRAADGDDSVTAWSMLLNGVLTATELSGAAPPVLAGLAVLDPDIPARFPAAGTAQPLGLPEAIYGAVAAVAEGRPTLLALDDADRARPELVTDLLHLAQRLDTLPVLLVLAGARSTAGSGGALDELAQRVARDVAGAVLVTRRFEESDLQALVRWAFPDYEDARRARLVRRAEADTGGNPFLAVELVRALQAGLRLPDAAGRPWPSANHTLDDTRPGDLPESVSAALRVRYRALSEPAQRALAAVAVLGGRVAVPALGRGAELSPAQLEEALDELEWSRWLTADSRGYTFVTSLAREVVLHDMVTGGQQRRIRDRAGQGDHAG